MMRMGTSALGWIGALMVLAAGAEAQEHFEWSGRMERGQTLEVIGISGDIQAVRAEGETAAVAARKRGRRSDFESVDIEMIEDGGRIVVCVVHNRRDRGGDACDYDDRGDRWGGWGGRSGRSIDVSVDFDVSVPAGVEFIGSMVSGDVEVRDVASEVTATSVSGDIYVSTTEVAWGTTVSGSIDIEMESTDWGDLHFSTVSGDITLLLPPGLDTEIEFESLSGEFRADFDVRGKPPRPLDGVALARDYRGWRTTAVVQHGERGREAAGSAVAQTRTGANAAATPSAINTPK